MIRTAIVIRVSQKGALVKLEDGTKVVAENALHGRLPLGATVYVQRVDNAQVVVGRVK